MSEKKSPARSSKKKKTVQQTCADQIVEKMNESRSAPTNEAVGVSKAIQTLRAHGIKNNPQTNAELVTLIRRMRGKILEQMVDEIVESETLMLTDICTAMEIISVDFSTIPMWENDNAEWIDSIINELSIEVGNGDDCKDGKVNASDILSALVSGSSVKCKGDCGGDE